MASKIKLFVHVPRGHPTPIYIDTIRKGGMEGATGIVFPIKKDPNNCVKLFKDLSNLGDRFERLQVMINRPPKLAHITFNGKITPQTTWPNGFVIDQNGDLQGFRMPFVDLQYSVLLSQIVVKRERKKHNITAPLIGAAYNLSAIVSSIHAAGHRIVDLKPENIFVQRENLLVTLIDCDDYHIIGDNGRTFPATAYTEEYTCPEWPGNHIYDLGKDEAQDRFALSILLFKLLNDGWHPFDGVPQKKGVPTQLYERIKAGLYPHKQHGNVILGPPPSCPIGQLQPETRDMFERAFTTMQRPSAIEWADYFLRIQKTQAYQQKPVQPPPPKFKRGSASKDNFKTDNRYLIDVEQGNSSAQHALDWIFAKAQHALGWMYANGRGVLQDDFEAIKWFRKAAKKGNAQAQYKLGWMYAKGRGVRQDNYKAVKWYRKSARQGNAYAQYKLGWMYAKGRGVSQDNFKAVKWYLKAASQGNAKAKKNLKVIRGK